MAQLLSGSVTSGGRKLLTVLTCRTRVTSDHCLSCASVCAASQEEEAKAQRRLSGPATGLTDRVFGNLGRVFLPGSAAQGPQARRTQQQSQVATTFDFHISGHLATFY